MVYIIVISISIAIKQEKYQLTYQMMIANTFVNEKQPQNMQCLSIKMPESPKSLKKKMFGSRKSINSYVRSLSPRFNLDHINKSNEEREKLIQTTVYNDNQRIKQTDSNKIRSINLIKRQDSEQKQKYTKLRENKSAGSKVPKIFYTHQIVPYRQVVSKNQIEQKQNQSQTNILHKKVRMIGKRNAISPKINIIQRGQNMTLSQNKIQDNIKLIKKVTSEPDINNISDKQLNEMRSEESKPESISKKNYRKLEKKKCDKAYFKYLQQQKTIQQSQKLRTEKNSQTYNLQQNSKDKQASQKHYIRKNFIKTTKFTNQQQYIPVQDIHQYKKSLQNDPKNPKIRMISSQKKIQSYKMILNQSKITPTKNKKSIDNNEAAKIRKPEPQEILQNTTDNQINLCNKLINNLPECQKEAKNTQNIQNMKILPQTLQKHQNNRQQLQYSSINRRTNKQQTIYKNIMESKSQRSQNIQQNQKSQNKDQNIVKHNIGLQQQQKLIQREVQVKDSLEKQNIISLKVLEEDKDQCKQGEQSEKLVNDILEKVRKIQTSMLIKQTIDTNNLKNSYIKEENSAKQNSSSNLKKSQSSQGKQSPNTGNNNKQTPVSYLYKQKEKMNSPKSGVKSHKSPSKTNLASPISHYHKQQQPSFINKAQQKKISPNIFLLSPDSKDKNKLNSPSLVPNQKQNAQSNNNMIQKSKNNSCKKNDSQKEERIFDENSSNSISLKESYISPQKLPNLLKPTLKSPYFVGADTLKKVGKTKKQKCQIKVHEIQYRSVKDLRKISEISETEKQIGQYLQSGLPSNRNKFEGLIPQKTSNLLEKQRKKQKKIQSSPKIQDNHYEVIDKSKENAKDKKKKCPFLKAHSHKFSYLYPTVTVKDQNGSENKRVQDLQKKLKKEPYHLKTQKAKEKKFRSVGKELRNYVNDARNQLMNCVV